MAIDPTTIVTSDGIQIPTLSDIEQAIKEDIVSDVDEAADTSPDTLLGQLATVFARQARVAWEAVETAYGAFDLDQAEGYLLDALGALSGTGRLPQSRSRITLRCNIDSATVLLALTTQAQGGNDPDTLWRLIEEFTAPSTGNFDLEFEAVEAGPVTANVETVNTIATPIVGWNSVTNLSDAIAGSNIESDTAYAARLNAASFGSGTVEALRAAVYDVVTAVFAGGLVDVYENTTDETNGDGLPAYHTEIILFDGDTPLADDDDIAQAIWDSRSAGTALFGTTSGNAADVENNVHVQRFTRVAGIPIYIEADVTTNADYPGDAAAKVALIEYLDARRRPGMSITTSAIIAGLMSIPGVISIGCSSVLLGKSLASKTNADLTLSIREIPTYESGNVVLT